MSFTSPVQGECEIFLAKKETKKITKLSLRCKCEIYFLFYSLFFFWFFEKLVILIPGSVRKY